MVACLACAPCALAQGDYPFKPIRFIVGAGAARPGHHLPPGWRRG
jgi:hypothetical protein